jgi:hypothetical protein
MYLNSLTLKDKIINLIIVMVRMTIILNIDHRSNLSQHFKVDLQIYFNRLYNHKYIWIIHMPQMIGVMVIL